MRRLPGMLAGQRTGGALGTDFVRARAAVPRAGRVQGQHGAGHHGGAFGWRSRRRLVTAACWYAALNIALAGAVLLVILRTGTRVADTANLTVYLRVSPLLLLALSGACCAAVEQGPGGFSPGGGTHQNRRSGAGALRPARPAARGA